MTSAFHSNHGGGLSTGPGPIDPVAYAELCTRTGEALQVAQLAHARAVRDVDILRQSVESGGNAIEVSRTLLERLDVLLGALLARLGVRDQLAGTSEESE